MARTKPKKNKFQTIRGVISAADVDDDDRVIGVRITTDDDDEYMIDPYGKGEFLNDMVGEYVAIKGIVHNDDGDYSLEVRKFALLDGEEEEIEDDF